MLDLMKSLINWEGASTVKEGKKEASNDINSNLEATFKENYLEKFPGIHEEQLKKTMLMVGNLFEALETRKSIDEVSTDPTVSLSDDNSAAMREQLEALQGKKNELQKKCESLERTVDETRRESDLWKLKTTMAMGNMRATIESLAEDKQCLADKCEELEKKQLTLRMENASKQSQIQALESGVAAIKSKEDATVTRTEETTQQDQKGQDRESTGQPTKQRQTGTTNQNARRSQY